MLYELNKNIVTISNNSKSIHIEFLKKKTVRIYEKKVKQDLYEIFEKVDKTNHEIINDNNQIIIKYFDKEIIVNESLNVKVRQSGCEFVEFKFSQDEVNYITSFKVSEDARIMGLGDKVSSLNKRGYVYESWATDHSWHHDELYETLYKAISSLLIYSNNHYFGLFFPSTFRYYFDLAKYDLDEVKVKSKCASNDVYVFLGNTPKEITSAYSLLLGTPYMIRMKMLGNNQSRWSYVNEEQVLAVYNGYKNNNIPLDYIHLDIHYLDGYRDFTVDKSRFPDLKGLCEKMLEGNVGAIVINDAGIKVDPDYVIYDYCIKNDLAAKHPSGETFVGVVWPGDSIFPNYFHPKMKKFWLEQATKFVEEYSLSGIWNDMNEPVSFKGELPEDLVFDIPGRKLSHLECHNVYAEHMVRPLKDVFRNKNLRPYLFTRSGFASTSKYAFTWNGDNYSLWHHLRYSIPQIATLGLSNFMFNGVDIGGFGGDTNKQLLIRWVEGNILIPFFRNHSTLDTKAQEPYAYDDELLSIYRKYLNIRYDLIPYLYNLAKNMNKYGELMLRPMFYNYPLDPNCIDINDQYMVGDSILCAPILSQDTYKRIVYFPKGTWIDYLSGKTYKGERHYIIDMPLGYTGIYIKNNTIIPTFENLTYINKKEIDTLIFKLYGNKGEYELYEDDGDTLDYEKGIYNLYKVSFNKKDFTLKVKRNKYVSTYKNIKVIYNGKTYHASFDGESDVVIPLE